MLIFSVVWMRFLGYTMFAVSKHEEWCDLSAENCIVEERVVATAAQTSLIHLEAFSGG
jgi:hypothetical protein